MAGQQVASPATVRRVGVRFLHLNGNKVLVWFSNRPSAFHKASHKEVLVTVTASVDALEVFHHVVCVGKDVVVTVEQEVGPGTAVLQPLKEQDLLQGQVQEGLLKVPLENVTIVPVLHLHELVHPLLLQVSTRCPRDEDPADPGPVVFPLLSPGRPEGLSPLVVLWLGLDDQQKENV